MHFWLRCRKHEDSGPVEGQEGTQEAKGKGERPHLAGPVRYHCIAYRKFCQLQGKSPSFRRTPPRKSLVLGPESRPLIFNCNINR